MRHLMIRLLAALALLLLAGTSLAQTPLALRNLGQRIDPEDARMVGRGGWGMALSDSLNPGFKNLAGLSSLRMVAVKFTGFGDHVTSEDGLGNERTTNRTFSPDIRAALPIIKGKLAFSTGFEITRSNQYSTLKEMTWYAWDDTLTGNEQFIREGTLWSVPFGLSWEVRPGLSVAGTVGLVRGTIRESVVQEFQTPNTGAVVNPAPLYGTNARVQEDEFTGTATTLSVLARPFPGFSLGASWRQNHSLDVDRKVSLGNVGERYFDEWAYNFPDEYRVGMQWRIKGRWHLGADYQAMEFTDYHGRDDWKDDLGDEYTLNVGLEREQGFERHAGSANLPLRLGYQYRQWGYRVAGEPVTEQFFSVGTGFPFRRKMGNLDVALSYGIIGDTTDNGVSSKVWRFTMSFTGLERWW
jgi:hypothetical protein